MKSKLTFSGCITKIVLAIIGIMAFVWVFSILFPRAYSILESKALGIKEDSVIHKVDTVKQDSIIKAQDTIRSNEYHVKLEHDNNCYYINVKINGIPMKMLLDTGASNIVISSVEYVFLKKQNLISDTTMHESKVIIANGDSVKCYSITLDDVTIGNKTIKNIKCIVMEQQDAPILLGMNVIKQLGNVSIDYDKNELIIE